MDAVSHIVRRSKSNLAFALACLPRDRRRDMQVFYAFCRVVDDIADEPGRNPAEKRDLLQQWRQVLLGEIEARDVLERAVIDVMRRREIPAADAIEIIQGVEMDIDPVRYETWEDLQRYTFRVAGAVGLCSIRIFGCTEPASRDYAIALGHALQLTNILRDVRQDYENGGRIYLPREDMARFAVWEEDIANHHMHGGMRDLLEFEVGRAREFYQEAARLLPAGDRHRLLAAQAMHRIYEGTLKLLARDGYRVFEKRYRLPLPQKILHVTSSAIQGWWGKLWRRETRADPPTR